MPHRLHVGIWVGPHRNRAAGRQRLASQRAFLVPLLLASVAPCQTTASTSLRLPRRDPDGNGRLPPGFCLVRPIFGGPDGLLAPPSFRPGRLPLEGRRSGPGRRLRAAVREVSLEEECDEERAFRQKESGDRGFSTGPRSSIDCPLLIGAEHNHAEVIRCAVVLYPRAPRSRAARRREALHHVAARAHVGRSPRK